MVMQNQSVKYIEFEQAPKGLQFFRCEPLAATLSVKACAVNWRAANEDQAERLFKCKVCPLGAVHAGETAASLSPLRGAMICGRCHRGVIRLVEHHLCVSCWNREREWKIGKNAKGQKPIKLAHLHRRALRIVEGEQPRVITREHTAHPEELMVKALRDCKRQVVFCWDPARPAKFSQRRLW